MNQRKELNLNIKKSTIKTIRKYLLVIFCCFTTAMIYPFINIYFGEYSVYIKTDPQRSQALYNANLEYIKLYPFFEEESRSLYSNHYSPTEYFYILTLANVDFGYLTGYNTEEQSRRAVENIKKNLTVFTSIKMVFGIEHYAKIFYGTFFSLLVIIIVIMNFKFNLKVKDE